MTKNSWIRWRRNFLAGLAVVLPAVMSVGIVIWLFGTVTNFTDALLFFLPKRLTHGQDGTGPILWYWSLVAFLLTILIISLVGGFARYYAGRKAIEFFEQGLLRVPLLNKIYGTLKQVNEAFSSEKRSSFKQVVLVEFPRPGQFSVGFVTGDEPGEIRVKTQQQLVSVFIPTTPNPTTGFLVLVPEASLTKLSMSAAEGIRFIISLGSVSPDYRAPLAPATAPDPAAVS